MNKPYMTQIIKKIYMKSLLKQIKFKKILKKSFPLFLTIFIIGIIFTPYEGYCDQVDDLQEQATKGNLPVIASYLHSFKDFDDSQARLMWMTKNYTDKGLDMIEHQGSFVTAPLTEKSFREWLSAVADIYYYGAYFLYASICDTEIDFETAKKYLTISCRLKRDYLKDKEDASHICETLDELLGKKKRDYILGTYATPYYWKK